MKTKLIVFALLFAVLCSYSLSYSAVPQMINYQGKITTPTGALVDTTVQMIFTIYDDSTTGTVWWADTQSTVVVEKGIFSVLLGSGNPIPDSVFDGSVRFLGTKVGNDPEMTPRKAMVSVAYAFRTGGDGDWTISGNDIYSAVSGNVGIGTSSPSSWAKLHVTTPVVTTFRLSTPSNDFSGMSGIRLDTPTREWLIANENAFSNGLVFSDVTASQHRLFISTGGNVGIGTTSPTQKLDVAGTAKMTGFKMVTGAGSGKILTSDASGVGTWQTAPSGIGGSGTANYIPKFTAATTLGNSVIYQFGSNVGIGTTSAGFKLHVNGNFYSTTVNTGQGNYELYGMNQNVRTSDSPTFYRIHLSDYGTALGGFHVGGTSDPGTDNLVVDGNATVGGNLTVNGMSMGKIHLSSNGTILSTDGGTRVLYWDKTNGQIEITNTSGDWCDYWWQAQKGASTSGGSSALANGTSNYAIISGTNSNDYGFEVHFGQADGTEGWCSVWLQYANGHLVGHYLKY